MLLSLHPIWPQQKWPFLALVAFAKAKRPTQVNNRRCLSCCLLLFARALESDAQLFERERRSFFLIRASLLNLSESEHQSDFTL